MIGNIKVEINNKEIEIVQGTTLEEISKTYQEEYKDPIIIAKVDGKYKELSYEITRPCKIEFLTILESEANRVYVNGLIFIIMYAAKKVLPDNTLKVEHPLDKGIFIHCDKDITREEVTILKNKIKEVIKMDLSIQKLNVNRLEAIDYFKKIGQTQKVDLLKYNSNTYIDLYKLDDMYNFFFGMLPVSTRCLERFDLKYLNEKGFVLLYQTTYMKDGIKPFVHHEMIFDVFKERHGWAKLMHLENVPSLNKIVSDGHIGSLIKMDEMIQSNILLNIAKNIAEKKPKIKIVLISGPSSSGKTTTCNKLAMYLACFGVMPKTISMDNYFLERDKTPKDEQGNYDYECLHALDLNQFDKDMEELLCGKEVQLPYFNFITGKPEPGKIMKLNKNDILIVEGIHGLNPEILQNIPRKEKFKIYISPLTALNFDNDNRISTTDNRLLRRMIRDNVHRGNNVDVSLSKWASVRNGEEKFIFPYQDEADCIFNSSLIYEFGVLKTYVEPLLYAVDVSSPYYEEAQRLINVLREFLPIPSDDIPKDSLLREFIGGSCFPQ